MADNLTAALDEIRERGYANGAHGAARLARLSDAAAVDVPRLLAALDEVLKLHQPVIRPSFKAKCAVCADEQGAMALWPCPEYEAVSRALLMPIRSAG